MQFCKCCNNNYNYNNYNNLKNDLLVHVGVEKKKKKKTN